MMAFCCDSHTQQKAPLKSRTLERGLVVAHRTMAES